jgi:hypothetical protein
MVTRSVDEQNADISAIAHRTVPSAALTHKSYRLNLSATSFLEASEGNVFACVPHAINFDAPKIEEIDDFWPMEL